MRAGDLPRALEVLHVAEQRGLGLGLANPSPNPNPNPNPNQVLHVAEQRGARLHSAVVRAFAIAGG